MRDEPRLRRILAAVLGVPLEAIGEGASMDTLASWDSLRHMNLIIALEEEFGVVIPDEDAAAMTSYELVRLVLRELGA